MMNSSQMSRSQQNLMDLVKENLAYQPDTAYLNLADQEINDLDVIIENLSQFKNLEELNLSNNLLTRLPSDMSMLTTVANLNL